MPDVDTLTPDLCSNRAKRPIWDSKSIFGGYEDRMAFGGVVYLHINLAKDSNLGSVMAKI